MRLLCRCTAGHKEWSSSHGKIHWQSHLLEGSGAALESSLSAWLPLSKVVLQLIPFLVGQVPGKVELVSPCSEMGREVI